MNETQLMQIIDQCKNYEISVARNKVDVSYINTLKASIADLNKLMDLLKKAHKQNKLAAQTDPSDLSEKQR